MLWKKKKLLNIRYLRSAESTRLLDKQFSVTDRESFSVTVKDATFFFTKRHDDYHYYVQTGSGNPLPIKVGQKKRLRHKDGTYIEFNLREDFLYSLDYSLTYYAVVVLLLQMSALTFIPKSWFESKPVVVEKEEKVDQKRVADLLEKLEKKKEPPKPKEKKEPPKPPEPPKVVKPEPPKPKPEPPKPKPQKKVVQKPTPKPTPPKKVTVRKDPPKRLVVQKGPSKQGSTPADKAKAAKAAKERAARAQARKLAMQKAKAASSLGFLAKGKAAVNVPPKGAANSQDRFIGGRGLAGAKDQTGKASLAKVTGSDVTGASSGPISTSGSRNIATGPTISDGEISGSAGGKSLNYVQGKVSNQGLHSSKGSGAIAFGPSQSMSVQGNVDQAAVRKAIEAVMGKLQYCYERGLLANPNMGGIVEMSWTIVPGGRVGTINVSKSALNDNNVHGCLMGVIKSVQFPSPKGGPAKVNYPFNFTSSKL